MPRKKEKKFSAQPTPEKTDSKRISQEEFEKRVVELTDKGMTSEKIGEFLRKEGIHPNSYGKKISRILKEKEKYISPDLKNVTEKLERIKKHYEKNTQDRRAMREKDRIVSQIKKIEKYLKV